MSTCMLLLYIYIYISKLVVSTERPVARHGFSPLRARTICYSCRRCGTTGWCEHGLIYFILILHYNEQLSIIVAIPLRLTFFMQLVYCYS